MQSYYDRTSRLSPQLNEIRNTLDIDFLYHLNWNGRQDLLLGAGARWSPDNITQKFATLDFLPQQETDSIYSWFLQDQISIVPKKLVLTLGSKFEHNNYSGFEVQPNGRLLWTPTDINPLWVAVTRAVRTPSRLDQDLQLTDFLTATTSDFPPGRRKQDLQVRTAPRHRSRISDARRPQALRGHDLFSQRL